MKLYSYIITEDTGFSPNPFWGCCTLADCKPEIRRNAKVGDWIVGLSTKAKGNRVVFAMKVDEILDYEHYYSDQRYAQKIPRFANGKVIHKCGDNIYKPLPHGEFQQLQSMHSEGERENPNTKAHDLGGRNVLIAKQFHYFGASGPELPKYLEELKVGRAHKSQFRSETITLFLEFINSYPQGVNAPPTKWPVDDNSWRQERE